MKRIYTTLILLLAAAITLSGCKNAATSTNSDAKSGETTSSNSSSGKNQPAANDNKATGESSANATATDASNNAATLLGTYAMSEVHAGGVVNMISQLKTEITFASDGTYSRVSKRNNNIYHTDAGEYRVEGNNQLVLLIKMAKQKIYNPPLERKHAFTLSRDGEELKMSSDDGKIAVFRKVKKS
jgi:predicted small secreted protein